MTHENILIAGLEGAVVPQDHVGLFDTPPTSRQIRFGWIMAALLVVAMFVVLAAPNTPAAELNAVVPVIDSVMLVSDLITATLLYVQATVFRSRALTVLASGFVFIALMLVIHMLTFPGAFAPTGLLGAGLGTTGWTYLIRRAALPITILLYVVLRSRERSLGDSDDKQSPMVWSGLAAAIALAAAATLLVTSGHDLLPALFQDKFRIIRSTLIAANLVLLTLVLTAIAVLFRKRRSVLDMWLLVVLMAWLIQLPVNMNTWARYTIGFYAQFALMPISHLILMLALIGESSRLYAQLALATAARKRERNAMLMSMDAMAATFAHEIGQPFTAVTTNAKAGLNYLTRPKPNVARAIEALRAALDAGKLTTSVIKSLRAMVATEKGTISEFSSNELVRQTGQLLHRELDAAGVSLRLELDESVPAVQADRVQVQLVLVNLLLNAIDALGEWPSRDRRITVRSTPFEDRGVLIEVSDSGRGIAPGDMERIFEAFMTTKVSGTGLGLAISRVLAEEQGGRLWAAQDVDRGATFYLQLPTGGPLLAASGGGDPPVTVAA